MTAMALAGALFLPGGADAQESEPDRCPKLIAFNGWERDAGGKARSAFPHPAPPPYLMRAAFRTVATEESEVRLTFVGHATFLIESPDGISIATDYSDWSRPPVTPTIATMNRAHLSHYTDYPDPGIQHVLRGWGENGEPAKHELAIGDVWLRNVTTNIRSGFGVQYDANSVFVFEVAGLCIAHLGHLHHKLTDEHLKQLGRIDVVLAPVDGGYTLNIAEMIETLQELQSPLIIPMHFFAPPTLQRFLTALGEHYEVEHSPTPTITLSRKTLPRLPTVLVLPGR